MTRTRIKPYEWQKAWEPHPYEGQYAVSKADVADDPGNPVLEVVLRHLDRAGRLNHRVEYRVVSLVYTGSPGLVDSMARSFVVGQRVRLSAHARSVQKPNGGSEMVSWIEVES